MNLLLDTHTLLWLADGDPRLSNKATQLIPDPANELFLSMASVWEAAHQVAAKSGSNSQVASKTREIVEPVRIFAGNDAEIDYPRQESNL